MRNGAGECDVSEKRKPEQDDPKQSARFLEDARRLGMDESGKSFQRVFKKIVAPSKLKRSKKAGA